MRALREPDRVGAGKIRPSLAETRGDRRQRLKLALAEHAAHDASPAEICAGHAEDRDYGGADDTKLKDPTTGERCCHAVTLQSHA